MKKRLVALSLIAGFIGSASAADLGIQGDVGTTGIGFHATVPLRDNINARVGLGYLGYSYSGSTKDMDYKLNLKANTYDALIDWYPVKRSGFRVTAGLAYNGNKVDADGKPDASGNFNLGGNTYSAASVGKVEGKVQFNKIAPYLGVGWGKNSGKDKGWSFTTDVGVMFQGSAKTSLSSSGCNGSAAVCNQLASDLAKENQELRHEANRFKAYPVLRVGVSYKF